jgi:hypothetical protein
VTKFGGVTPGAEFALEKGSKAHRFLLKNVQAVPLSSGNANAAMLTARGLTAKSRAQREAEKPEAPVAAPATPPAKPRTARQLAADAKYAKERAGVEARKAARLAKLGAMTPAQRAAHEAKNAGLRSIIPKR